MALLLRGKFVKEKTTEQLSTFFLVPCQSEIEMPILFEIKAFFFSALYNSGILNYLRYSMFITHCIYEHNVSHHTKQ
jgi:hypothetical protein